MFQNTECLVSNFQEEYDLLCHTNGWNILFQRIKNNASNKMMNNYCNISRSEENRSKNKFREIVPYDYNRVLLPKSAYVDSDYINASFVRVNDRTYNVTQYPYKTLDLFWLMVWNFKTPGIIMLGKVEESQTESYFPKTDIILIIKSTISQNSIFSITVLEKHSFNGFFQRKLRLYNLELQTCHDLWHFEFWSWPDQMAPKSMISFLMLIGMVRDLQILDSSDHPAVIHCSAGAGRSGTFCLIDLALLEAEKAGTLNGVNISELMENLRVQRMGMVHSAIQLKFSYEAVIEAFKRYQNNRKLKSDKSYLLSFESTQLNKQELNYSSSSDSTASETVYYKSTDEENESDFSDEFEPHEFKEIMEDRIFQTEINKNTNNVDDYLNQSLPVNDSDNVDSANVTRQRIISERKQKNVQYIDQLTKHLEENNMKRFRIMPKLSATSSTISLLEEINDNYYWSIFIVSGTIFLMGACLWIKYNPFK